ncbi:uncharacterized protein PpBr36_05880, partial [Pyricularia pennisetigena]|uniref:uncharacterized protein n=1 Tax=Pyricularia pennisetigena TaxID=1578925 RepID=UPI00114FC739
ITTAFCHLSFLFIGCQSTQTPFNFPIPQSCKNQSLSCRRVLLLLPICLCKMQAPVSAITSQRHLLLCTCPLVSSASITVQLQMPWSFFFFFFVSILTS